MAEAIREQIAALVAEKQECDSIEMKIATKITELRGQLELESKREEIAAYTREQVIDFLTRAGTPDVKSWNYIELLPVEHIDYEILQIRAKNYSFASFLLSHTPPSYSLQILRKLTNEQLLNDINASYGSPIYYVINPFQSKGADQSEIMRFLLVERNISATLIANIKSHNGGSFYISRDIYNLLVNKLDSESAPKIKFGVHFV